MLMFVNPIAGHRRRHFTAAIALTIVALGCGGGGAAVDAGSVTGPSAQPESPAPPSTPPSNAVTTDGTSFIPATITIAQGATVTWQIAGNTHNVTFGTNKPTGGDAPNTAPGGAITRTFPAAGTFPYQCTLHSGMAGTVIVQGATAAVFTSVAVTPATPSVTVGATAQLSASALDQDGSAMAGLPAATWTSSNTSVATVNATGIATGVAAGSATITASMISGAVTKTGTATITVTAIAGTATVTTPNKTFSPRIITVTPGSTVTWQFSGDTHNVTFGALKPAGGNIPDIQPGNAVSRTFATPGSYDYQCTWHGGMTGQVVVTDGAAPPTTTPPPGNAGGVVVQATPAAFTPERIEIAPGGTVTWEFSVGLLGIVFDQASPPGGNIPEALPGSRVSRTFPVAGDYDYHSSKNAGVQGRIRVR
jgi:plastocyanin